MTSTTRPIPSSEWEQHKDTLAKLYSENPLKQVRSEMQDKYGFNASPWQYEMQFKRWGFRKYTARAPIETVIRVRSQAREDRAKRWASKTNTASSAPRDSGSTEPRQHNELHLTSKSKPNEVPGLQSSAQPLVTHWNSLDSFVDLHVANSPGVSANSAVNSHWMIPEHKKVTFGLEARSLPSHRVLGDPSQGVFDAADAFSHLLDANQEPSGVRSTSNPRPGGSLGPVSSALVSHSSSRPGLSGSESATWFQSDSVGATGLPPNYLTFFGTFVDANTWRTLPFAQLDQNTRPKNTVLGRATESSVFDGVTGILLLNSLFPAQRGFNRQHALRELCTLLPGDAAPELTLVTHDQAFETDFIRMLLFSMLNNFVVLSDLPLEDILKFLTRAVVNEWFLDILQKMPKYVSRTLAENIFRAAIEAEDVKVVRLLLRCKVVDVNSAICADVDADVACALWMRRNSTPLQRAASLKSLLLVRTLIIGGADIHAGSADDSGPYGDRDVLSKLLKSITWCPTTPREKYKWKQAYTHMVPELVNTLDLLVDSGARVLPWHLRFAGLYSRGKYGPSRAHISGLAVFLAQKIRPEDHEALFQGLIQIPREGLKNDEGLWESMVLSDMAKLSDHEATQIFQLFLDLCARDNCNRCLVKYSQRLEDAVIYALRRGHVELTKLLFSVAYVDPRLPQILTAAAKSGNRALIGFILEFDPDLDPPAVDLSTCNPSLRETGADAKEQPTTPIAEAVRDGNHDLIRILEEGGALSNLTKGGRCGALIEAAAENDPAYLKKILTRAVTSKQAYRATGIHLRCASTREATLMLLEAGAVQNDFAFGDAERKRCPLYRALAMRDTEMVHHLIQLGAQVIQNEHIVKAIEWGDISVIANIICENPIVWVHSGSVQHLCRTCITTGRTGFFKSFLDAISFSGDDLILFQDVLVHCLEIAVQLEHVEMVSYFLDMGASPCNSDVLKAAIFDQPHMLQQLFQKERRRQTVPKYIGARILESVMADDTTNSEALNKLLEIRAVNFSRLEHLEERTYEYDDVSETTISDSYEDLYAITPLGLAIQGSRRYETNITTVKKLLELGADANGIAKSQQVSTTVCRSFPLMTALAVAVQAGWKDAVEMLLAHGAVVDGRPRLGTTRTPLQYAAEIGSHEMVRLLLRHKADVNSPAAIRDGATALQFAAMSGNCNIAAELLQHGAQFDTLPSKFDGRWPLEGAAEYGRLDMIRFLWEVKDRALAVGVLCDGFTERHCLRAMKFAQDEDHLGCRDLIAELSGISVDRLETDEFGAPWIAY